MGMIFDELFGHGRCNRILCNPCDGRRHRRSRLHGSNLLPLLLLVRDSELVFHLHAKLVGGAAELTHQLAELTREFGQLLRTKEEEGENKEKGAIAEARHN